MIGRNHGVVFYAKAEHLAQRAVRHTIGLEALGVAVVINDAGSAMLIQGAVDELTDPHHACEAITLTHEDVIVTVHAHDNDAVIAQLREIELVLADAAAKCGDERAHLSG